VFSYSYSYSYSTGPSLFEHEYEYHFIEYEYEGSQKVVGKPKAGPAGEDLRFRMILPGKEDPPIRF
jgi:hypothetical protein